MANPEHLKILKQGVEVWNKWREENPEVKPDIYGEDLYGLNLYKANFSMTNLGGSDIRNAFLLGANMSGANLEMTLLSRSDCRAALFDKANLTGAEFIETNLQKASFRKSVLSEVNFSFALLIETDFSEAQLHDAIIYGASVWDLKTHQFSQRNLRITPDYEPEVTVDDLEVAQLIYLMLNNQNIRNVIETITSKAVLILGRFTQERKKVLDALKDELRLRNYLPIVFDFDKPSRRDIDETVNLLARMSRFVVADVTDAKSIPQELKGFVEGNPSVPVVPLILKGQSEYGMFEHFRRYPWVLPLHEYTSPEELLTNIIPAIIVPAERKVAELRGA